MLCLPHLDENSQASIASSATAFAPNAVASAPNGDATSPQLSTTAATTTTTTSAFTAVVAAGSAEKASMNSHHVHAKRPRMDDAYCASRSPTLASSSAGQMRRSQSVVITSMDETYTSPKRDACFMYCSSGRTSRSRSNKPVLRRVQSFSDSRKSLDFNEDHGSDLWYGRSHSSGELSKTDSRSSSSLSTNTDFSIGGRAAEEESRTKWLEQTDKKRKRPASTGGEEEHLAKAFASPPFILSRLLQGKSTEQRSLTECAARLSELDVSQDGVSALGRSSLFTQQALEESMLSSYGSSPRPQNHDDIDDDYEWLAVCAERANAAIPVVAVPSVPTFVHPATIDHVTVFQQSYFETPTREQLTVQMCKTIDVRDVVKLCQDKVKVVILDLDQTLLSIHTNGKWLDSAERLGEAVRPVFKVLFSDLLQAGLPVGIATFSTQEELIKDMLISVFGKDLVRINENVFVRGSRAGEVVMASQPDDDEEDYMLMSQGLCSQHDDEDEDAEAGKRKHIQSILSCIPGGDNVAANQVLFVDDDSRNVSFARKDQHRVVHFRDACSAQAFLSDCRAALIT